MNLKDRKKVYSKWQEIYASKIPFIFLVKGLTIIGVQNSIGNFYQQDDGLLVFSPITVFRKK